MPDDLVNDTSTETSDIDLLSQGGDDVGKDLKEDKPNDNESNISDDSSVTDDTSTEEQATTDDEIVEEEAEEVEETQEEELSAEDIAKDEAITRPTWKELKDKYPGIDHNRGLREIFFREQAYSQVFSTVDDAKAALDQANILERIDASLVDGDPEFVLSGLAQSNPETVEKLAEKFLPTLYKLNPKLYAKATQDHTSALLNSAFKRFTESDDKNGKQSVLNLCKFLYGDFKLPPLPGSSRRDPEVERKIAELDREKAQIRGNQAQEFTNRFDSSIDRQLGKILNDGLTDVKNEFIRRGIIREAIDEMKFKLKSDNQFTRQVKFKLEKATREGFSQEHLTGLITMYLQRAKPLVLAARAKAKTAAIGERRANNAADPNSSKRVEGSGKNDSRTDKPNLKNPKELMKKYSDEEILNMR